VCTVANPEVRPQRRAGVELQQYLVVEALQVHGLRLDHGHLLGDRPHALEAGQRLLHVVEHAEVQDDVERAQLVEVDLLEVGHQRFDLGVERRLGEVEAVAPREVRAPEVGLVASLVGQRPVADALLPVGTSGHEVDPPGVVVEGHHPGRAPLLGGEGELAVPGADVEDAAPGHVGEDVGRGLLHADALGHDPVAQVDGVVPPEGVSLRLQFRG